MLNGTAIQKMKQTNISVNPDKTKERVNGLWKSASNEERIAVETLADVKRTTIARIYRTGNISAKLAVSIAQILNTDPFYLTGESDTRGKYTKDTLKNFMEKNHYEDLLDSLYDNSDQPNPTGNPEGEDKPEAGEKTDCYHSIPQDALDSLTGEDVMLLMGGLLLRAEKLGGEYAEHAREIKALLIK